MLNFIEDVLLVPNLFLDLSATLTELFTCYRKCSPLPKSLRADHNQVFCSLKEHDSWKIRAKITFSILSLTTINIHLAI